MRKLVRTRLKEGDSNAEVIDYMQERYGDYVLLKPPVQTNTYILWFLPFILLLGGLGWFFKASRKTGAES
jgi:cytochrome c-type biogenesis protein CcmH